ncbi:MAG: LptF/LptG family permease [Bacteroidota bacterium]
MKKIDRLLLTSYVGPFAVSFGIALFVLIMQFLWLYIDEIAGKGVSVFVLIELIGYLSISTFPMALPIAVLIASVMVMGSLAERYELSSMKSAGVSMLRVMRGLIFCAVGIMFFSYICSDYLIPISNLKFKSRLYDIRKQKPALTLEKGVFNEDFKQFVIRIGDKKKDGETITNVLIEDQTNVGRVNFNQILSDSGQMYTTDDKRYFVMNLFKGTQYQQPSSQSTTQKQRYPFVRTNFSSWTKVWDMKEFEMTSTDPERFKSQRSMLSMNQLRHNIDSLEKTIVDSRMSVATDIMAPLKKTLIKPVVSKPPPPATAKKDAARLGKASPKNAKIKLLAQKAIEDAAKNSGIAVQKPKEMQQVLSKPLTEYESFDQTFPATDKTALFREGRIKAGQYRSVISNYSTIIDNRRKESVKTGYELFSKYSFALVCLVFLFIGAPMGAIIRKGGFGYPVLVSIIFFVTFIMLTILCRKFAELEIMSPFWAAMLPCIILMPIAAFLTRKAMNDSQMINTDGIQRLYRRVIALIRKKSLPTEAV